MGIYRNGGVWLSQLALEKLIPVADHSDVQAEDLGAAWQVLANKNDGKVEERKPPTII
jgi:hypothetical protein